MKTTGIKFDITPVLNDKDFKAKQKKLKSELEDNLKDVKVGIDVDVNAEGVGKVSDELKDVSNNLENVKDKFDEAKSSIGSFADTFFKFEAIGQVGEALTNFAQSGINVRDALLNMKAQAGLTNEEVEKLKDNAELLFKTGVGSNLAETYQALATAQQQLGNFLSEADLTNFTRQAAAIGQVFDKDVNEVLSKSRTFIANFGLDGEKAANLVSFAMQKGGNAMDDVLDTMDEYSQLASLAGYNAEEFVSQITQAVQLGLRDTDKLADSIKESQIRINAGDYAKPFEDMITASEGVEKALQQNVKSILDQAKAGDISIKQALQLSASAIKDAFDAGEITASMRDQLNVAISGTMAEDIGGEMWTTIFAQPIDTAQIQEKAKLAGEQIASALGPITMFDKVKKELELFGTSISQKFGAIAQGIGGVLTTTAQFAPAMSLAFNKDITDSIQNTFSKVSESAKGFAKNLSGIAFNGGFFSNIKQLGLTLLTTLVPSFAATGTAGATAGTAITASWAPVLVPILGVATAIAAVAGSFYLLYENSESFRNFIDALLSSLEEIGKVVWENIVEVFSSIWDYIKEPLSYVADAIAAVGTAVGLFLIAPFWAFYEVSKVIAEYVGKVFVVVWEGLVEAMKEIADFISSVFLTVWNTLASAFDIVYNAIESVAKVVGQTFYIAWQAIYDILEIVGTYVKNVFINVWEVLKATFNFLLTPIYLVIDAVDFLTQSFRAASSIGIYVKGLMEGVSQSVVALGESLSKAWASIKNLDFKGFLNAVADTPKKVFDAFKKGTTETIILGNQLKQETEAQKKSAEQAKKASEEASKSSDNSTKNIKKNADDLRKINSQSASDKAKSDKATEKSILEQYNLTKKQLDEQLKQNQSIAERERLTNNLKKTVIDDLNLENAKIEKLKKQKELLIDIVENAGGTVSGDGIIISTKLKEKEKDELQKELANVLSEINNSEEAQKTLEVKANIDTETARKQYEDFKIKTDMEALNLKLKIGEISEDAFNAEVLKLYQKELATLQSQINDLESTKGLADSIQVVDIQREIDDVYNKIAQKQAQIDETSGRLWATQELSRIKTLYEGREREMQIELFFLETEHQAKLDKVAGNEEAITRLVQEEAEKRAGILAKYQEDGDVSIYTQLAQSIGSAFKQVDFSLLFDANDEFATQLDDLAKAQKELDNVYLDGEASYSEYASKLNAIDEERSEVLKKQSDKQRKIWQSMNASIYENLGSLISDTSLKMQEDQIRLTEEGKKSYEVLQGTMNETATIFAATSMQMIATGSSLWKSLTLGLLSALKAQAPVLIAMMTGIELGSKGVGGLVTLPLLTGLFYGLIAAAESAVKSAKFAKGGLVSGGEQLITVNELGQEFVMNASTTKKNLDALFEINKRDITIEQYAKERYASVVNIDTSGLEKRLERIETAIKQEARFKTHIDANINIDDKEIIRRAEITKRQSIRRF